MTARSRRKGGELISQKTRREFREWFVENSHLREIEASFADADIARSPLTFEPTLGGERRALVEQYYASIDWTNHAHVRRVLDVYEVILDRVEDGDRYQHMVRVLERDGYRHEQGRIVASAADWDLGQILKAGALFESSHLQDQIDRIRQAVDEDPGLAIGTSKELVETTCKTLLDALGEQYDRDADVGKLVKQTCRALNLTPEDISDTVRGADAIRRVLGQLATIAVSLAELRNLYGTGHGRGSAHRGLQPRHARLAVGCAATFATFLFETYQHQQAENLGEKAS
ncbi:MAG: abortive infection family protein [Chloroflexi bacterium]|nr:abortive infection family protein [Chloroflexota bacterium]